MIKKEYVLRFTYTGPDDFCRVFDYLQDRWVSFEDCAALYGEDTAKRAMFNPGRIVKSDDLSKYDQPVRTIEQMIKSK